MTTEEKARAYDEALERAQKATRAASDVAMDIIQYIFPEFAESEDERNERIQKFIAETIFCQYGDSQEYLDVLAYIEKQKDASKAIEAVERIDKYIDENVANAHDMKDSNPDKEYYRGWDDALGEMAGILQDVYSGEKKKESLGDFIDDFPYSVKKEQNSAESEDERIRKWIKKEIEDKYVVEGIVNNKLADEAFGWLEKQKHLYETTKDRFYREGFEEGQLYEKQKEQKPAECIPDSVKFEEGFKAGRESGLRDGQKYVLNNLDSYGLCKPAEWSEEDEKMLRTIISDGSRGVELDSKQISWLKSLRRFWNPSAQELGALKTAVSVLTEERTFPKAAEQIQKIIDVFDGKELRKDWKPSEEQMKALEDAFRKDGSDEYRKTINSLYQDLKKL